MGELFQVRLRIEPGPNSKRVMDKGIFRGRREIRYRSWGFQSISHGQHTGLGHAGFARYKAD